MYDLQYGACEEERVNQYPPVPCYPPLCRPIGATSAIGMIPNDMPIRVAISGEGAGQSVGNAGALFFSGACFKGRGPAVEAPDKCRGVPLTLNPTADLYGSGPAGCHRHHSGDCRLLSSRLRRRGSRGSGRRRRARRWAGRKTPSRSPSCSATAAPSCRSPRRSRPT